MTDANALDVEDPLRAVDTLWSKGPSLCGIIQGWPNDTSTLYNVHKDLIKQKKYME